MRELKWRISCLGTTAVQATVSTHATRSAGQGRERKKSFCSYIRLSAIGKSGDLVVRCPRIFMRGATQLGSILIITMLHTLSQHLHFVYCIFKPFITNTVPILNEAIYPLRLVSIIPLVNVYRYIGHKKTLQFSLGSKDFGEFWVDKTNVAFQQQLLKFF